MPVTTISYSDFKSIRRQANRELEAEKAGFGCHADMVAVHRAERVAKMRRERDERRAALLGRRDRLRAEAVSRSRIRLV